MRPLVSFDLVQELVGVLPRVCTFPYAVEEVYCGLCFGLGSGPLRIRELVSNNRCGVGWLRFLNVRMVDVDWV